MYICTVWLPTGYKHLNQNIYVNTRKNTHDKMAVLN